MMNKSKIEWCDRSWNPITGCRHGCGYCYAAVRARRFCGDIRLNLASPQVRHIDGEMYELEQPFRNVNGRVIPMPAGFGPTFHKYRLGDPAAITKKSANIFVGSMADVFGEWVPDEWIESVFTACKAAPWHRFLFLTKNPGRFQDIDLREQANCEKSMWFGFTAEDQKKLNARAMGARWLPQKTFVSLEPLQGPVDLARIEPEGHDAFLDFTTGGQSWLFGGDECGKRLKWVIVGAETGGRRNRVRPKREWVAGIVDQCRAAGIPVFLKNNLADIWGEPLIQEMPEDLKPRPDPRPRHHVYVESVRDKKVCSACGESVQGRPAYRMGGRKYECAPCFTRLEAESWENLRKQ